MSNRRGASLFLMETHFWLFAPVLFLSPRLGEEEDVMLVEAEADGHPQARSGLLGKKQQQRW